MKVEPELQRAALLGIAAGLRTFTPAAALVIRRSRPSGRAGTAIKLGAVAELVADKLPQVPSRTTAPSLIGRLTSGCACGYAVAGALGAGAAGVGAVAGTFGGFQARRWLTQRPGLPNAAPPLIEDSLAVGLSAFATRRG